MGIRDIAYDIASDSALACSKAQKEKEHKEEGEGHKQAGLMDLSEGVQLTKPLEQLPEAKSRLTSANQPSNIPSERYIHLTL